MEKQCARNPLVDPPDGAQHAQPGHDTARLCQKETQQATEAKIRQLRRVNHAQHPRDSAIMTFECKGPELFDCWVNSSEHVEQRITLALPQVAGHFAIAAIEDPMRKQLPLIAIEIDRAELLPQIEKLWPRPWHFMVYQAARRSAVCRSISYQ
jgi:hypothetical protein